MESFFMQHHHASLGKEDDDGIGSGWENEFTEALAFYLACDVEACSAFCRAILGSDFEPPAAVWTQHRTGAGTPDLAIRLGSGRLLLVENKIDDNLNKGQLEKYLTVRDNAGRPTLLAFFAKKHRTIPKDVMSSPSYRRPAARDHFLWHDLWAILPQAAEGLGVSALRTFYREYLRRLGFAPTNLPGRWRLLFEDREEPENREVQVEFGNRLGEVRAFLNQRGFRVTAVSYKGLEARPPKPEPYLFIKLYPVPAATGFVHPEESRLVEGAALVVAVVYEGREPPDHARRLLAAFSTAHVDAAGRPWCATGPTVFSGQRTKVEFVTGLPWFLEEPTEIPSRIGGSCASVLARILDAAAT